MCEQQLQLHKSISDVWKDNYVVPLYQRNFAWTEEQIGQLLQDLYDHHEDCNCNYYLGSLVVLYRPKDGLYEVIDGQQRLTALQIICKELEILKESKLRYDSRPEVEDFFEALFNSRSCKNCYNTLKSKNTQKIHRLIDALNIVASTKIRTKEGEISLEDCSQELRKKMSSYLSNNVMLIRVSLPLDTDVAAYFEIMNNRGQQLQAHEVIKALIMGRPGLDAQQREVIATVWDACSQMDIPIQSSLSAYRTNNTIGKLFGEDYDSLRVELLDKYNANAVDEKILTIDGILGDTLAVTTQCDELHQYRYKAIIDFPNFLTHVFKMYDDQVELNGDNLAREYGKISEQIEPMKFISMLLTLRTLFDRYVVRVQAENEEDEDLTWVLHKPYLHDNTLKYKNTFPETNDDIDDKTEDIASQKRIVKQLSMLQVSFRNRKYKRWLFDYLKWLKDNYADNINAVPSCAIEQYLDSWIESYYQEHIKEPYIDNNRPNELFHLGVDTPHFLFNFIDYLYWVAHGQVQNDIRYIKYVGDFNFKYYNSVEHHRPQSYNNEDVNIDSIGNLCLISRRSNSSLNDKDAREKAKIDDKKLQPKRKIMYKITQEGDWGKKQIEEHEQDIKQLLDDKCRCELLNLLDKQ